MWVRTVKDLKDSVAILELESVTYSVMCFGEVLEPAILFLQYTRSKHILI